MRWQFTQLGGEKKVLVLDGYAAPFGRPRQHAIMEEAIKLRQVATRYPGNSGPPTRHVFGHNWTDEGMTLTGRWMNRKLEGKATAESLVEDWQAFIADEQKVQLKWGDLLEFTGIVEGIKVGWESSTEVVWTISFLIDTKVSIGSITRPPRAAPTRTPDRMILDLNAGLLNIAQVQIQGDYQPDFFDTLDNLTGILAGAIGTLVGLSNQLAALEKQTFSALQRIRLAIGEVRTAALIFGDTVDSSIIDTQMFTRQSVSDIRWFEFRQETAFELSVMADILAELDRNVELVLRGQNARSYQAIMGDTWESISSNMYGGVSRANDIRAANGITGSMQPVPGATYRIPA